MGVDEEGIDNVYMYKDEYRYKAQKRKVYYATIV